MAVVSRLPVWLSSSSQSTIATLAEPIVSDAIEFLTESRVSDDIAVQLRDRVLDQLAAAFGADDDAGANLAQLDHVGDLDDAVEQAEAGVGDVVNHRLARQAEAVMHAAGGGRLEKIAADRAVNQCAEKSRDRCRWRRSPCGPTRC